MYLHVMYSKTNKHSKTTPSNHTNYRYLKSPEKCARLHQLHQLNRVNQQIIKRLRAQKVVEKRGIQVDDALDQDL